MAVGAFPPMEGYNNHEPHMLIHTPRTSNIHPPSFMLAPSNCIVPSHWLALSLAEYGLWGKSAPARRGQGHILHEQRSCWLGGATRQEACVHLVEIGMYLQRIWGCSEGQGWLVVPLLQRIFSQQVALDKSPCGGLPMWICGLKWLKVGAPCLPQSKDSQTRQGPQTCFATRQRLRMGQLARQFLLARP